MSNDINFTIDSNTAGLDCPCPPPCPPPFPPPFPPPPCPPPRPVHYDDNLPYSPATYADVERVRCALHNETIERMKNDKILHERCDDLKDGLFELSGYVEKIVPGGGGVVVDEALSLTSKNPVQNKVLTERILSDEAALAVVTSQVASVSGSVGVLSGSISNLSGSISGLSEELKAISGDVTTLSGAVEIAYDNISDLCDVVDLHTSQIEVLSSDVSRVDGKVDVLSGWCNDEFVKDEFTDFMPIKFAKEIRGGYSDDDILLIGTKKDGLHYILPGDEIPTRCICPSGQVEFDGYQFRNIIKGDGIYVATNRDAVARTNVYVSQDGITWEKKNHTIKHTDTNGNVCYSSIGKRYFHIAAASEYPEAGITGYCIEVSTDLENWTILEDANHEKIVTQHDIKSLLVGGKYLYAMTIGNAVANSPWYIVFDLETNTIKKQGNEIFNGQKPAGGWMRWVDNDRVYWGCYQNGVANSDRIITTDNGFETFDEYVINPNNKLGVTYQGSNINMIIRSLTKFNGIYFIGTYETSSPHILMSYDMNNWHIVSTPPFGIGADMLCPFQERLYVGYSGDASEEFLENQALLVNVKYTYHTDHLVIHGILQDVEGKSGGGTLKDVTPIPTDDYDDKVVKAKVNEIIAKLGGKIDPITEPFTDDDIVERINLIIAKHS